MLQQVKAAEVPAQACFYKKNELQIRGQAFRDDWCEVEPICCCFLSRRISEVASSLAAEQIRKLPISHPILTSSPVTAALQNCGSSASRLAVPSRLQKSLLPGRTIYPCPASASEKRFISPRVGLGPSPNACTKEKNCCT